MSNFDETVQKEIDSGNTMLVRFVASPGWGWWLKQAPAWNTVTRAFAESSGVSFGDVDLSNNDAVRRDEFKAGSGGWPTIRYFNKDTGLLGGEYVKKTDRSMCDELGDEDYMTQYVDEYTSASICSVIDGAGCDERQLKYAEKMKVKTSPEKKLELVRLEKMKGTKMKPELKAWIDQRRKILNQLVLASEEL